MVIMAIWASPLEIGDCDGDDDDDDGNDADNDDNDDTGRATSTLPCSRSCMSTSCMSSISDR